MSVPLFERACPHTHEALCQIYRGGQHRQGSPQLDNMAHLPTEIVHLILRLLGNPDKVALALTSKRHMALVESARKVSAKRLAVTKTRRLAVLVRLHDWMPPGLKLCYSCIKFIPSVENGPWHGDFTFLEKGLASKTALENGPHCNSCYRRDQVELAKASTNAQRLKKKVREM
jgi:hypothetical protein